MNADIQDFLDRRQVIAALRRFRRGDFSVRLPEDMQGQDGELAQLFNEVVDLNQQMTAELERLSCVVGKEGKITQRGRVKAATGGWESAIHAVNELIEDMVQPTAEVARVIGAVAKGDLLQSMTVEIDGRPLRGEFLRIGKVVNTMVEQLASFTSEVTRVAREVGTEGKLGGQATVRGVAGTWKDLTDNVNAMATNLTGQVRNIAEVTTAVASGDLSKKITVEVKGEILELKNTINTMVDQLNSFASEVTRVAREVGTEGKLGGQARVEGVAGTWKDLTDNVNLMAENLTGQVRNIAEVTTAVASGDLSKKITVDVKGEILELKNTINTMVDQLNSFASEVTRVAREVGTDGKLGGQARVEGVGGIWKDLTDNVNLMAGNLTGQVRNIAEVTTAVARGDLSKKITVDVKGEILELKNTINVMVDQLNSFASEVSRVAREVGTDGKLGGQARVPGAAGLWRDLTDNVNQLAANLTNQVRSIADVATAVTKGDLSRSIAVEASGEMASLKDNINEMIRNLKDQTLKNAEQDWLKTNLARFSRMLQGERDLATVSNLIMSELAPLVNAQYGVFYVTRREENETVLDLVASYGAESRDALKHTFKLREGLVGQCAADKRAILLSDVPGDYVRIGSGLGHAAPVNIAVLPALFEDDVKAVIELASFSRFNETHQSFLDQLMESVGIVLNTIAATMRTEGLLKRSQLLTQELQARQTELTTKQEELHTTNEELQEKAQLLENEKKQVEAKNFEIDLARRAVEEKAEQLSLTSKYKSEFLANMSHELRTPLNSLLILSRLLSDNPQGNLNEKQVEFARTIHSAGSDLLSLINDILDLSKIESGTVSIEIGDMSMNSLRQHMERTFRQLATDKNLDFKVKFGATLPASIRTDEKRLQQIVLNLLSNAFKFTSRGNVTLAVNRVEDGWSTNHPVLRDVECAIAIAVTDTGIGIPKDKQKLIFEAFQQADGTTSRKYGGTGLGLSISREIARLLGGELQVRSTPGQGSTFTLFVPMELAAHAALPSDAFGARYDNSGAIVPNALPVQMEVSDDRDSLDQSPFVLIVEDDATFASILLDIAREVGLKGVVSTAGAGTLTLARKLRPNAITLDLGLSDIDGFVLLDLLKHDPCTAHVPIHIISSTDIVSDLSLDDYEVTEKPATLERLNEVFANLARRARQEPPIPVPAMPDGANTPMTGLLAVPELAGAKILIVDDDIRNIYSLTSVLESYEVEVLHAETGRDGILILEQTPGIDLALIDIMMPEMDGYETMQQIRALSKLAGVPLIAVTAKAMKGDRQKCLDAGASDYIAKPVDIELLLALLRAWVTRSRERRTFTHTHTTELALENHP
ncbi:HAMP domain-containing protein [Dyella humi]|uniref:histidine kinase n=1 Tax=Dyella humi TaxID=1770547 RepID=A0ABW8IFW8_9GAMM